MKIRKGFLLLFLKCFLVFLLFCPSEATLNPPTTEEGQSFNLRSLIYLPKNFKEKKYIKLKYLNIPELGLKLTNVEFSFNKEGIFFIKIASGEIDPEKIISFLLDLNYLKKALPFSINGPVKIVGLNLKIAKDVYHIEIKNFNIFQVGTFKNLLAKNLNIDVSPEIISCKGSLFSFSKSSLNNFQIKFFQKEKLININFDNCTLETEELQRFAETIFHYSIEKYQKKFVPWITLNRPFLKGKIFIKPKEIVFKINKEAYIIEKVDIDINSKNIDIISQNEKVLIASFNGNFLIRNNHIHINFQNFEGNLIKLQTNFPNIKTYIQNVHFKSTINATLAENINLSANTEIISGNVTLITNFIKDTFFFQKPAYIKMSFNGTTLELSNIDLSLNTKNLAYICIKSNFYWPFNYNNYKKEKIYLNAKNLKLESITINNLNINKNPNDKTKITFQIETNQGKVSLTEGLIDYSPEQFIFQGHILSFSPKKETSKVSSKKKEVYTSEKSISEKPIDFSFLSYLKKISSHWKILFDSIEYGNYPELENFSFVLDLSQKPLFSLTTDVCYTNLDLAGEIEPSGLIIEGDLSGVAIPVNHFLACFLTRAPVYILGQLTYKMSFDTAGKSPKELFDNFYFNLSAEIQNGKILKVSNLNEHLRWLLKALSLVKLNPSKLHDAIVFDSLEGAIEGNFSMLKIKKISLTSPILQMNLVVTGTVKLKPKIEKNLEGTISVVGLSKHFEVKDVKNNHK